MRNLSVVLLSIFLLVSMSNIGISSDDIKVKKKSGNIKVKNKDKKKSKKSIDIKSKSMKVSGGSSIVMGSIGNVTNNNKNIKDGQIIINDTVISDDLIKDGKLKNVKVKNNRAWIDGKEIDLKTGKLKEPVKLTKEDITKLHNFFGKNWKKYIEPKIKLEAWKNGFKYVFKRIVSKEP